MNVYVWYVVSMFVNDIKWWSRHNIFRKGDTRVEIIRMCIIWEIWFKEVSWLY